MQSKISAKKICRSAGLKHGLTLIELMVTIAVIGVILVFAVPNFTNFVAKRRVAGIVNQFAASVQLAKSEAQTVGRNVSLCAANADGTSCKGGTDWSSGWLLYVQGDTVTDVQKVIQVFQSSNITIELAQSDGGVITITPAGFSTSKSIIKIKPQLESSALNASLGKTLTYEDVTMKLSIGDGA